MRMRLERRLTATFLATLLLCACATSGSRPTLDLYGDIQTIRLYSFHCTGSPPEALEARLEQLKPWLASELGAERVSRMEEQLDAERGLVDLVRRPTAAEEGRSARAYARLLSMLERRARR